MMHIDPDYEEVYGFCRYECDECDRLDEEDAEYPGVETVASIDEYEEPA